MAAYALICDESGRVLLTRQGEGRERLSRWLLPGGGVEAGEHPEEAVVRECLEETGLNVQVGELLRVVSDMSLVGRRRRQLHSVRLVYRARIVPRSGTRTEPTEAGPHESGLPANTLPANTQWWTTRECERLSLAPFVATVLSAGETVDPPAWE